MRTPFDRLLAMADRANDHVNAEPFRLHPQVRTANGRPVADPDRAEVKGRGVFDYRAGEAGGIQTGNRSHYRGWNDLKTPTSGRTPTLSVSEAVLAGTEARQGDRVDLLDRGARSRYEIVSVWPDGHGRVMLELVQI